MLSTRLTMTLGLFFMLLPYGSLEASVVRAMTLDDLVQEADQIVVGKVLAIHSEWDSGQRTIFTSIQIQVNEGWKGNLPNDGKMTLIQQGGVVGETEMAVQGMPKFSINEHAVLFLRGALRPFILGMNQGKRTVHYDGVSKRWFVAPPSHAGVIRLQRKNVNGVKPSKETMENRISLDDFRNEVQSRLNP